MYLFCKHIACLKTGHVLAKNLNSGLKIRLHFIARMNPMKILRHMFDMKLVSTFSWILNKRELSLMSLIGSLSGQMEITPSNIYTRFVLRAPSAVEAL